MAKQVRMADIAAKLVVSIVSVSKALAGKEGVGEEMRPHLGHCQRDGLPKPRRQGCQDPGRGGQDHRCGGG